MSMSIDEIQGLLESLSAELGSSLVLDDAEQHLVAHTGHDGSIDDVRRESILGRGAQPDVRRWFEQWGIRDAVTPIRTPADPTSGVRGRWCIPVRHRGELLGFVSAFDTGQVNDEALDGAMKTAEQLAAVLFRRRLAERTDAELVRHVIHRGGLSDDPTDAYPRRGNIAVVVIGFDEAVDPDGPMLADLAAATRRATDVFPRGTAPSGEIGGLIAALVPIHRASDTQPAKQLAETALRTASRSSTSSPISAGISSGSCTASTASTAYAEARRALRRRPLRPTVQPDRNMERHRRLPHPGHDSADQQPRQRDRSTRSRAAPTRRTRPDRRGIPRSRRRRTSDSRTPDHPPVDPLPAAGPN